MLQSTSAQSDAGESELVDNIGHHAPDMYKFAFCNIYGLKLWVFWCQKYPPLAVQQPFYGQLAIQRCNDNLAVRGLYGTVNYQQVAIVNARSKHGFPVRPQKKRGRLVAHQVLVQV